MVCAGLARLPTGPRRDVELERVHQLVADHMVRVGERPAHRQNDAPAQRLGDAAGAFAELALDDVGLLEVRMRRVEHERLAAAQLVLEHFLEPGQPALGHPGGEVDPFLRARVVVDVEVLGLEHLEVEVLVLNLVAPEVLGRGRRRGHGRRQDECQKEDANHDVYLAQMVMPSPPRGCAAQYSRMAVVTSSRA